MRISSRAQTQLAIACDSVIDQVFHRSSAETQRQGATVIALTAPHPEAGVSHITRMLANRLALDDSQSVLVIDGRTMKVIASRGNNAAYTEIDSEAQDGNQTRLTRRTNMLEQYRQQFQYVLLDCPSLTEAQHIIGLASLVDGVLMVVEANCTQKRQLQYAIRTLESVGGRLLGQILNKRTYVVPEWLHSKLMALGV